MLLFYYGLPLGQTDFPATIPEWEMFDLINDPNEIINVYDREEYKEIWNELKDKLIEL